MSADRRELHELIVDHIDGFVTPYPTGETTETTTLDDIGADSLDRANITMAIEERLQIEISDMDWQALPVPVTVGAVIDMALAKRATVEA